MIQGDLRGITPLTFSPQRPVQFFILHFFVLGTVYEIISATRVEAGFYAGKLDPRQNFGQ